MEGDISFLSDAIAADAPTGNVILGPDNSWLGVTWDFGEPPAGMVWQLDRFDAWIAGEDNLRRGYRADLSVSSSGLVEEFTIIPNSMHWAGLTQNSQYNHVRYDFPEQFVAGVSSDMHRYPVRSFRYLRLNSRGDGIDGVDWQTRFVETDIWVSLVPEPPVFTSIVRAANGDVTLTWSAFPSRSYNLEYKTDLDQPEWTFLATIVADEENESHVDSSAADSQRFYRLVIPVTID